MNQLLLKKAAIQSVALMFMVLFFSYALEHYHSVTILAKGNILLDTNIDTISAALNQAISETTDSSERQSVLSAGNQQQEILSYSSTEEFKENIDKDILDQLGERYLIIKKPTGIHISYQIEDLYLLKSIRFTLKGEGLGIVNEDMITRVHEGKIYRGMPQDQEMTTMQEVPSTEVAYKEADNDIVSSVQIERLEKDKTGSESVSMLIGMDHVYVQNIYEDDNYYYINLRNPKVAYDKVIVIDPGHGGKDAGAISIRDGVYEKEINLLISLQLKKILDKSDIKVYYTRLGDDKVFLKPRIGLANDVDSDFYISIHNNACPEEWPHGTEILYYDNEVKGIKNKNMADIFSEELGKAISLEPQGTVEKHDDDVFVLNHSEVPSVLIEVGYLTNRHDMNYLSQESNQEAVAEGIYNGIMRLYKEYKFPDRQSSIRDWQ